MACNTKTGPAAYIKLVQTLTGEKITQQDWHDIKKLAGEAGYDVSRTRVEAHRAAAMVFNLGGAAEREAGTAADNPPTPEVLRAYAETVDVFDQNPKAVTQSTMSAVQYLTEKGIAPTLAAVRAARANKDTDDLDPAVAVEAENESRPLDVDELTALHALDRKVNRAKRKTATVDEKNPAPNGVTETQRQRRGHAFYPEANTLPALYSTDGTPSAQRSVEAHYFTGNADFFLTEYDPKTGEAFGYTYMGGEGEWGYIDLKELETLNVRGQIVERDLYWDEGTRFGSIRF